MNVLKQIGVGVMVGLIMSPLFVTIIVEIYCMEVLDEEYGLIGCAVAN